MSQLLHPTFYCAAPNRRNWRPAWGLAHGGVPAHATALAYFVARRTGGRGTANMILCPRDYFGRHRFARLDDNRRDQHGPLVKGGPSRGNTRSHRRFFAATSLICVRLCQSVPKHLTNFKCLHLFGLSFVRIQCLLFAARGINIDCHLSVQYSSMESRSIRLNIICLTTPMGEHCCAGSEVRISQSYLQTIL